MPFHSRIAGCPSTAISQHRPLLWDKSFNDQWVEMREARKLKPGIPAQSDFHDKLPVFVTRSAIIPGDRRQKLGKILR